MTVSCMHTCPGHNTVTVEYENLLNVENTIFWLIEKADCQAWTPLLILVPFFPFNVRFPGEQELANSPSIFFQYLFQDKIVGDKWQFFIGQGMSLNQQSLIQQTRLSNHSATYLLLLQLPLIINYQWLESVILVQIESDIQDFNHTTCTCGTF